MNKFGISGILNKSNNEFFNMMIWSMKMTCDNIINNGAYQPETKQNALKMVVAINDYINENNKRGL